MTNEKHFDRINKLSQDRELKTEFEKIKKCLTNEQRFDKIIHGYGKAAARLALEEARSLGFHHYVGKIREDNIASLRAYASLGVSFPGDYEMCYIPKLDKEVKMLHLYLEL